MAFKVLLFLTFFFAVVIQAFGKETWVQFVGINEKNPQQNYASFYQSAVEFSNACRKNPERICETYINPDQKLMGWPDTPALQAKASDFKGLISKQDYVDRLKNILSSAGDDDKVVISMNGHGYYGMTPSQTSCFYLSRSEKICDDELKEILKSAKPTVKVAVIVDSCYSGGFTNVSGQNVCVATTADQRIVSFDFKGPSIWKRIANEKLATMADLTKASAQRNNDKQLRLGSYTMQTNNCEQAVKKINANLKAKGHHYEIQERVIHAIQCINSTGNSPLTGDKWHRDVFNAANESAICNDAEKDPTLQEICRIWKKHAADLRRANSLSSVAAESKAYEDLRIAHVGFVNQSRANFNSREFVILLELTSYVAWQRSYPQVGVLPEPLIGQFPKERQLLIRAAADKWVDGENKLKWAKPAYTDALNEIQKKLDAKAWHEIAFLRDCLMDPADRNRFLRLDDVERTKVLPTFTPEQISEAKSCENNFSF